MLPLQSFLHLRIVVEICHIDARHDSPLCATFAGCYCQRSAGIWLGFTLKTYDRHRRRGFKRLQALMFQGF